MTPTRSRLVRAGAVSMALAWVAVGLVALARAVSQAQAAAVEALVAGPEAYRVTERGSAFATALERIERALPPSGPYLLVDAGGKAGEAYWVRHRLAPRLASLLGTVDREGRLQLALWLPEPLPSWVVVVEPWPSPPRLLETIVYLQPYHQALVRGSDPRVVAALASAQVDGSRVVIEAACAAPTCLDCDSVRVFLEGRESPVSRVTRYPLRDLPGSGATEPELTRAGFRISAPLDPALRGKVVVSVVFLTADGRLRAPLTRTVDVTR